MAFIQGGELNRRDSCPFFHGVKIFSATKAKDRDMMSETVTTWLLKNEHIEVVDYAISLSSDSEFHCLVITLFFRARAQEAVMPAAKSDPYTGGNRPNRRRP